MDQGKKLNLNKYAFLDYLKGDIFAWLNCNENYQTAAKEDSQLRELTPWRYKDEEDVYTNQDHESEDTERYGLDLSKELPDQIKAGLRVGEFSEIWAKVNYPDYKFITIDKQTNLENIEYTKDALRNEKVVIFEATFTYNDFVTRTDILVKDGDKVKIIEVKGSSSPKLVYGYDLFFQKEIIERSNPEYTGWEYTLLLLNKEYIHSSDFSDEETAEGVFVNIDYIANGGLGSRKFKHLDGQEIKWTHSVNDLWMNKLNDWIDEPVFEEDGGRTTIFTFKIEEFLNSHLIETMRSEFDSNLERIKEIQLMDRPPVLEFEKRNNQFMSSDYMNWAFNVSGVYNTEDDSVFDFKGNTVNFEKKCQFFNEGLLGMGEPSLSEVTSKKLQKNYSNIDKESEESIIADFIMVPVGNKVSEYGTIIQRHYRNKEEHLIHRNGILDEISKYEEGIIYMYDFETANLAIPVVDGTKPYEQVVYQYSIHVILDPKDYDFKKMHNVVHYEWLAENRKDFHIDAWKNFVKVFEKHGEGTYVAWNDSFEKGCLRRAQTEHLNDNEIKWIDRIADETIDLMVPFRNKYYYHKDLKGSYSIKYAGPHFAEEINYKDLPLVQRGDQSAAVAKKWLRDESEQSEQEWKMAREGMLKYCEYDTLLMVAILQRLKEKIND